MMILDSGLLFLGHPVCYTNVACSEIWIERLDEILDVSYCPTVPEF